MSDAIFDGANLYITLPSIGAFDVEKEFYSAWKEWVILSDNSKYPPAFDTTGGDDIGSGQKIAPYFFCRNDLGWKIKMPSDNGEIIVSGNLFPRNSAITLFEQTTGFDAFVRLEVSTRAVVVEVGASALTAAQDASLSAIESKTAPLTATVSNQIDVNIQSVNGVLVTGTGATGDEWGP